MIWEGRRLLSSICGGGVVRSGLVGGGDGDGGEGEGEGEGRMPSLLLGRGWNMPLPSSKVRVDGSFDGGRIGGACFSDRADIECLSGRG